MKNNGYAFLIFLTFFMVVHGQTNYCSFPNCNHTMCIYPNAGPSSQCTNPQIDGLSAAEQLRILIAHNTVRQKVASGQETRGNPGPQPAGTIPNLVWNGELATIAQRWADQCALRADICRRTAQYPWVNQNLGLQGTFGNVSMIQVETLVTLWANSVVYFDKNTIPSYSFNANASTYSQLVWGATTDVGCGAIRYGAGIYGWLYLVCNYGPGGNVDGQRVYQT